MTSSSEESSPSSPSAAAVQPSATLIEALHHKLCDPSIVPNFESCRAPHVTQRLLTNRWVLQSNNNNGAQSSGEIDHDGSTTSATQNNQDTKYNQVPTRNYLDIRIEQNTTFANEQCLRCQKKLAVLSSSSSTTKRSSIDYVKNRKQIKKITDTIQSHLNEGLAACPNHDGLMKVDLELKCLVDRMNGVDDNIIGNSSSAAAALVDSTTAAAASVKSSSAATIMPQRSSNDNIMGTIDLPATTTNTQQISRAQAAINDALVEKMMSSQNDAVGANNNDADGNDVRWVPPTSNGDKDVRHGKRDSHSDDSDGKKRNGGHNRRRKRHQSRSRSRSADRHEQDDEEDRGRKRKRKHGSHRRRDERKERKRRYRSRSPQSSAESLSSRSISRERNKRKHRRDRHSHKKRRRHKSSRGKDKKKSSSKRRHRSRRERSTSFSSSSSSSSKSMDDTIGRRFEPPTTLSQPSQQSLGEKTTATASKDDFGLRFEPPSDNKASSDEKLSGASRRQLAFIPPSRSDNTGSDESMKSKMQQRFAPKKSG